MPLPLAAAAIGAGSQLLGNQQNAQAQRDANMQSQMYSEHMYNRQKADNIEFWNMQNAYNAPSAQMARFKDAGLNPNLIYGQGNPGNSGSVQTPDVQPVSFRSPEPGNGLSAAGLTFMNAIYDLDIKQAQARNLETQNEVIRQEFKLKEAQTFATLTSAERSKFDLDFESELRPISADARREQLRKTKTDIDLSLNRDARDAATNASSLREAVERMRNIRAERGRIGADTLRIREGTFGIQKDNMLKDFDINLRRLGLNPNDPTWARVIAQFLTRFFEER